MNISVCHQHHRLHVLVVRNRSIINICPTFLIILGIRNVFDVLFVDVCWTINVIHEKENCFVKMILSSKCDEWREGYWLYVAFRKYIHRCFACQNLVQSHEFIRRIRPGRIYHAECLACSKCKRTLQDDDIISVMKSDQASFNDLDCLCQTCLNPNKVSVESNEEKGRSLSINAFFPSIDRLFV